LSSADEVIAAHFPIVSISIISGIAVGVAGIFFKLREIAKDNRKSREDELSEKLDIKALAEKLEMIVQQQNKKIDRLENIIFKLPNNGKS
jgi:hypothetical protein